MSQPSQMSDAKLLYIVAASKPWHKSVFEDRHKALGGEWRFVESIVELDAALHQDKPRFIFFMHWNWIVPKSVVLSHECVCFHMTDLPFGRGGSPLQNLIIRGATETKLTALRMVEALDAGPVYGKRHLNLNGSAEAIYLRAAALSWDLVEWIVRVEPQPIPQCGAVTLFRRRVPAESVLPDTGTVPTLYDFIRMLDAPTYPKAFLEYGCFRIELYDAHLQGDQIEARVRIRSIGGLSDGQ